MTVAYDDGKGLLNSRRSEEIDARANAAPNAIAGLDQIVCPGDWMTFDATASDDINGEITQWTWMFSDGVKLDGAVVERSFDRTGPVDVQLMVMDDSGAQCNIGTDNAQVLVNTHHPASVPGRI